MHKTRYEFEVEQNQRKEEGFAKFMEQPMTKLALSLIPAADNKETLQQLLNSCWLDGFGSGSGSMAVSMLESILKPKGTDERGPF